MLGWLLRRGHLFFGYCIKLFCDFLCTLCYGGSLKINFTVNMVRDTNKGRALQLEV